MNNFWSLVGFEYKKIFQRKSVMIAIMLVVLLSILAAVALAFGADYKTGQNNYQQIQTGKEQELILSGRALDSDLMMEAVDAYKKIPANSYPYSDSEEYEEFARPYSKVYQLVSFVFGYSKDRNFGVTDFQNLTKQEVENYYELRKQVTVQLRNKSQYTSKNREAIVSADQYLEKPFVLDYTDGYERFFTSTITIALLIMSFIAFVISPVFNNEYQKGMDNLILTSKNGKKSQIRAKIFVATTISVLVAFVLSFINYLFCMMVYGFDGTKSAIQIYLPELTYDFTMLDTVVVIFITSIFGAFFMMSICLFLSATIKNPITVLGISFTFVMIGMLNGSSIGIVDKLQSFLPVSMATFYKVIYAQYSFAVLGKNIWLYQAVCMVAFIVGIVLLAFSYQNFKKHQIA